MMHPGMMDPRRMRPRAWPCALLFLLVSGCGDADSGTPAELASRLGDPISGVTEAERASFLLGRGLFERQASAEEGLGPLFNAERCSSCHDQPTIGGGGSLRVIKASRYDGERCDVLARVGGDNIQQRATEALAAHGITAERIPEEATATAAVTAPPLFGLGLLAAIPQSTLERRADPDDADRDGVSGRLGFTEAGAPGRFGRKSEVASISDFVDSALRFELGLTTPAHPVEELINGSALPAGVDPMPEPEIDDRGVELLTEYIRLLAPPAALAVTGAAADTVRAGRELFETVGCAACHTPMHTLSDDAPGGVTEIAPYTDLLLHDMGPQAADVCAGVATPSEYRTAALWGLRVRTELLHDGSAGSVAEALARHGGEAEGVRARFAELSPEDRAALLRFLATL